MDLAICGEMRRLVQVEKSPQNAGNDDAYYATALAGYARNALDEEG
jgi:hypothetical protein